MVARSFYAGGTYVEHYLGMRWPLAVWSAVLEQAIDDAIHGPHAVELKRMAPEEASRFARAVRQGAEDWIADDENEPRRFVWVCDLLDLDPDAVRRSVNERRHG